MVQGLLECAARNQADEVVVQDFAKGHFTMAHERMPARRDHDEAVLRKRKRLELLRRIDGIRNNANIGESLCDRAHDLPALALLQVDVDVRMGRQEGSQSRGKKFHHPNGIRQEVDVRSQPFCVLVQLAAHLVQLLRDNPRMMHERRSCRSELNAAPLSFKQRHT